MYVNVQGATQRLLTYGEKCGKQDCYIIVTLYILEFLFVCFFILFIYFFTELKGVDWE